MAVGAVSGGGSLVPAHSSVMSAQESASEAAATLLGMVLDMAVQQNAQLLEAMRTASPAGLGDSINTWA